MNRQQLMSDSSLNEFEQQIEKEIKINADGKGFASIRGTARLVGVDKSTLLRQFSTGDKSSSKLAQILIQKGFNPTAFSETGVPDIAVHCIVRYYAWMNGQRCTEQARQTDDVLGAFGSRIWMQKVKGWKKTEDTITESSFEIALQMQLPANPSKYQPRFSKRFWDGLEELYGLRQGQRGCAPFINAYIYSYFPTDVRTRLDEINPILDGKRANKQHQHFKEDGILLKALITQIERVISVLQISDSRREFRANMAKLKPYYFTKKNNQIEGKEDA
jgi:hypothetical protein